ncbi:hypothetical protein R1sor_006291 [Riccia sorocarpa]|uniref:Reverse transcriptase zinc-binding domain-containing protein n=1 Tax=Riccia sorocarpa TaxID=122646 RepID=A0ABD3HM43_9MARC
MPFISLSKSQGVCYLGVLLANKPNPSDSFDFILHSEGCLDSFPKFTDWSFSLVAWTFNPLEWRLLSPISTDMYVFPFEVSEVHSLFREEQTAVVLPSLSVRWSLDSTLQDWLALFGKLWAAGARRRDGLFLWRILLKRFFTGARASLIGVSTVNCRFCNLHMEDITHLFFLCPCKARDWMILASTFPFLRPLILMLLAGEPFPAVLRSALFFPKGLWLFTVSLFSTFLREIWKQMCTYVYDDIFQHIPFQLTLALLGEKLVGQYIVAGRARRKILAVVLHKTLEAHWLLQKSLEVRIRTVLG